MNEFIKQLLSNPLYVIATFFGLTFFGWLIFVKLIKVSKVGWKRVDFVWLPLTAISIFGVIEDNRVLFMKSDAFQAEQRAKANSTTVEYLLNAQWICIPLVKSESSSDDFEFQKSQRTHACQWTKDTFLGIKANLDSLLIIDIYSLPQYGHIKVANYTEHISEILKNIEDYNNDVVLWNNSKKFFDKTKLVDDLVFFYPIVLILAFAIRAVKTIGEIKIEQESSTPNKRKTIQS